MEYSIGAKNHVKGEYTKNIDFDILIAHTYE